MDRTDTPPTAPRSGDLALSQLLDEGITWGDSREWLPVLPRESVDLFFTSPPYADARAYSRIHPDRYVAWFLEFAEPMLMATKGTGWFVLNIKNRVARSGQLKGQRHPYVYELVLALQQLGWRWIETYIWSKPNSIPGKFGPRTKDSFEYVYAFAAGQRPHFDLESIRVPYKTAPEEIRRRLADESGRRNTEAGFGRDRPKTYSKGGADPGNVISVGQTYNQHYGPAGEHSAVMPEGLAEFFVKACCPLDGVVIDPFAGSATTTVAALRHGRRAGGIELHANHVEVGRQRIDLGETPCEPGVIDVAV